MRLRATATGVVPLLDSQAAPAEPARRNWLKRLGAVLTGAAVTAPALAAPRKVAGYEPLIGEIMLFGGNFAPQGWALCDGRLVAISDYTALYSLIGTTYGGDGQSTFGLPDLRGRAPRHQGQGPGLSIYTVGQAGGSETRTLISTQLPSHAHSVTANATATTNSPVGAVPAVPVATDVNGEAVNVLAYGTDAPLQAAHPTTIVPTGGSQPFDAMTPSLVMSYCIALDGIYPSRS
ncbi:phage tail protein [Hymenobacter monticola]|uniref:Tail fiber protein n=1 Tax=Hymenobacter monticola TaxID=1705399 RepID=A0ABY4AZK0_9BACT|nr:tail fiber protein [Hymenobacter monticola]UOE32331.1 tail fiber protein [Hymenobacter monticola]